MFLWFVVLAPVLVAEVFRSPMIDYRLVALGAVLPLIEGLLIGPFLLHTLLGAVAVLGIVMATTRHRRLLRRQLLGIPIGLLLYLVLGAVWTRDSLFLWPLFGTEFEGGVPIFELPMGVNLGLELIAAGIGVWAWRRYALDDPDNRRRFVSSGQLSRAVMPS